MQKMGVIIPVYNQALPLICTLHGFLNQTISTNLFKVVVVDDGSTQDVKSICQLFQNQLDLTYKRIENRGRSVSRNQGVKEAEDCDVISFCDADRIPVPDFLEQHLAFQEKGKWNSIVIGNVKEMYVTDPWNNLTRIFKQYLTQKGLRTPQYCGLVYKLFGDSGESISNVPWIATFSGNMSISTELFQNIKGFDPGFSQWGFEHFELGYRVHKQGINFLYHSLATNIHISHPREDYRSKISKSHSIFYKKHNTSEVKSLLAFMNGEISLNDFNKCSEGYIATQVLPDEFVKITNF
ncbi:glycosyltransferase [Bacillus sp. SM2101]|uniref:glycosyltransferase family 2 protein n=1 Tax=Bacillus sp. SM2101 TaxID=2805366 RepID=UPI001BDE745F|nr:glycosyltransferase [Bacillus sp. SM2101]